MPEIDENFDSGRKWVKHVPKEVVGDEADASKTARARIMEKLHPQTSSNSRIMKFKTTESVFISEIEQYCAARLLEEIRRISSPVQREQLTAICTDPDRIIKNILPGLVTLLKVHPGDVNPHNVARHIQTQLKLKK